MTMCTLELMQHCMATKKKGINIKLHNLDFVCKNGTKYAPVCPLKFLKYSQTWKSNFHNEFCLGLLYTLEKCGENKAKHIVNVVHMEKICLSKTSPQPFFSLMTHSLRTCEKSVSRLFVLTGCIA